MSASVTSLSAPSFKLTLRSSASRSPSMSGTRIFEHLSRQPHTSQVVTSMSPVIFDSGSPFRQSRQTQFRCARPGARGTRVMAAGIPGRAAGASAAPMILATASLTFTKKAPGDVLACCVLLLFFDLRRGFDRGMIRHAAHFWAWRYSISYPADTLPASSAKVYVL